MKQEGKGTHSEQWGSLCVENKSTWMEIRLHLNGELSWVS